MLFFMAGINDEANGLFGGHPTRIDAGTCSYAFRKSQIKPAHMEIAKRIATPMPLALARELYSMEQDRLLSCLAGCARSRSNAGSYTQPALACGGC